MAASGKKTRARRHERLVYLAIALAIIAIAVSTMSYTHVNTIYVNQTKTYYINQSSPSNTSGVSLKNLVAYNITSALITPLHYLPADPPINSSGTPGDTLNGINTQINATDLAVINNASDAYFETAGEMLLNGTLKNQVGASANKVKTFIVNGKPSVIYFGSITCVFCGENRWAMALALGRFGNFSALFTGYSALQDSDVPTIYWSPAHYNSSTVDLGSFYSSKYLNFIAIEDTDPITGGFSIQTPFPAVQEQEINKTGNLAYIDAIKYISEINNFQGTPYTIWGSQQVSGADAIDFGNSSATAPQPLESWTHAQIFSMLAHPNSQFAWTEYAAADVYIAMACSSLNNNAEICQLPAIVQIQKLEGY
jgi:hypothetical protein